MRIAHQSPTELVVKDSSFWLTYLNAGIALLLLVAGISKTEPRVYLGAALFLLFAAITARGTTFTFDGMQRVVRWNGFKLFKKDSGTIPFDDIEDVTVEASSSGNSGTTYRLSLLTKQGAVPMAYAYSGSSDSYGAMRREILTFLKPGLQHAAPPAETNGMPSDLASSIRSLLAQGRKIDAITLLRSREHIGLTEAVKRIDALAAAMHDANTVAHT
jgi:hypothetical protein